MTNNPRPRKSEFKAALAFFETTASAWAQEHEISVSHLNAYLAGERDSGRLDALIGGYVADFRRAIRSPRVAA